MGSTKIDIEKLKAEDWGPLYAREFDLVIAENVLQAMRDGKVLYNRDLEQRVADFCAPLDGGLEREFLGVFKVSADLPPHQRVKSAVAFLAERPRGHWAVFEQDGKYDGYIADGCGGIGSETGMKFQYGRPDAAGLDFPSLYAAMLATPVYHRRYEIEREIVDASLRAAPLAPGETVRDVSLAGKTYGKIEFQGVKKGYWGEGNDGWVFKGTRRGVKPETFVVKPETVMRVCGVAPVMPEQYQDPTNGMRLTSLTERRQAAAQAAFDELRAGDGRLSDVGSKAQFRQDGDTMSRAVYLSGDHVGMASASIQVRFADDSDEILEVLPSWEGAPAPRR